MGHRAGIDCRTAARWVSAVLDQELPDDRRRALQAHLQHCRACASLRDQLKLLRACSLPGATPNADGHPH